MICQFIWRCIILNFKYLETMENISVNWLNVQKQVKGALLISGVSSLSELQTVNLHKLTTDINHEQIDLIRKISEKIKDRQSMWQKLLEEEKKVDDKLPQRNSIFLVKNIQLGESVYQEEYFLDEVFGLGEITEICGPSGWCKTQIAMQLWLNVQTPKILGGLEGEALFVDTKGDFLPDRLNEMARWYRMKLMKILNKDKDLEEKYKKEYTEERILERVYYYRILDEEDQTKFFFSLDKILTQNSKIRLVVFDILTLHLKMADLHYGDKKRILSNVLVTFLKLAKKHNIWIVLNNTLKTSRNKDQGNKLEPNFGEVLFQSITNRISIDRDIKLGDDIFKASLLKGSIFYQRNASFEMHFQIKESGVSSKID